MKRPTIIIIGIVLVLLLLGVWLYLLFGVGGEEAAPEQFADLNMGDTSGFAIEPDRSPTQDEPLIDMNNLEIIQQLTTTPVIGFEEVRKSPTSTKLVYYTEPGTGNIYSINLSNGAEERVSGTTVPGANMSAITPNGTYTMVKTGQGVGAQFSVGEIQLGDSGLILETVDDAILDFTSTQDNTFLYLARAGGGTVAKELDPSDGTTETLFSLPFNEVRMDWGRTATATHFLYPKANKNLEGFLYSIKEGVVSRLPVSGLGLTAVGSRTGVMFARQENERYETGEYVMSTNQIKESAQDLLPEKCVYLETQDQFFCGVSSEPFDFFTPDEWYEGVQSYSDDFWSFSLSGGISAFVRGSLPTIGRELDLINPQTGFENDRVLFQNKHDNTLWIYHIDREPNII